MSTGTQGLCVVTWLVALASSAACSRSSDLDPAASGHPEVDAPEEASGRAGSNARDAGPAPESVRLCDGSAAIRLELSNAYGGEWGPSDVELFATHGLGSAFAFIDGRCHYTAGRDSLDGIHEGVLDETTAQRLADEVGFEQLAAWQQAMAGEPVTCGSTGGPSILGPDATVQCACAECACGCGTPPPPGLSAAAQAQARWLQQLNADGEPPAGPVRVVAKREPDGTPEWELLPWPLSRPVSELLVADGASLTQRSGTLIEGATDVAMLRALRAQARQFAPIVPDILVRDGDMATYRVFVRDELPDDLIAAIEAFRAGR